MKDLAEQHLVEIGFRAASAVPGLGTVERVLDDCGKSVRRPTVPRCFHSVLCSVPSRSGRGCGEIHGAGHTRERRQSATSDRIESAAAIAAFDRVEPDERAMFWL